MRSSLALSACYRRDVKRTSISLGIKIKARQERTISVIEAFNRNEVQDRFTFSSLGPPRKDIQCMRLRRRSVEVPSFRALSVVCLFR